jgi:repressor LexA
MSNVLLNMSSLTARQQEVLSFIEDSQSRLGVIPSTREIQQHFGFASQTAAVNHLKALQRKGIIQRLAGKARAVALVSQLQREPIVDIPIFGTIPAGMAVEAEQEDLGTVSIDSVSAGLSRSQRVFALRVRGDSMINASISDGDLAVLEMKEPRPGDIVAALIDGETTLKRYLVDNGQPYLRAENELYPDLMPIEELVIQGVMVALIRRY